MSAPPPKQSDDFRSFLSDQDTSQHLIIPEDENEDRETSNREGAGASGRATSDAGTVTDSSTRSNNSQQKQGKSKTIRIKVADPLMQMRMSAEGKVVGLKDTKGTNVRENEWLTSTASLNPLGNSTTTTTTGAAVPPPTHTKSLSYPSSSEDKEKEIYSKIQVPLLPRMSVEEMEFVARKKAVLNPFYALLLGNIAALKVMGFYLITLETFLTCGLTAGLTVYWYNRYSDGTTEWNGGGLDFVLLAFAVTSPVSAAIGMAFQRRERALIAIGDFRSFAYHLFLAHCLWDWPEGKEGAMGRAEAETDARHVNWVEHCDAVLAQLIGMGDELSRFLTLPSPSRSRHRMTKQGRREAARTMEVAYALIESMSTQRMTRLVFYSERLKKIGLPSGEISRIRQYERFLTDLIEQLRIIKLYRTPQALRSFARIFTLLLPPFYAPTYAQVAIEVNSLGVGICFGIITAIGLTALFETLQVLEDPFTAFLALDGIDAREEFEVLHYSQLIQTRKLVFPDAPEYPKGRRGALTSWNSHHHSSTLKAVGKPVPQTFHSDAANGGGGGTEAVGAGISSSDANGTADIPAPEAWHVRFESKASDLELGAVLPDAGHDDTNRESAFDEDRALFGVTDEDIDDNMRTSFRHRTHSRKPSRLDSLVGSNHTRPSRLDSLVGSNHTRQQLQQIHEQASSGAIPATPHHRHKRTISDNLGTGGLIPSSMHFRIPDC